MFQGSNADPYAMSDKPVTLINVFTVEPGKQQELIKLLIKATEGSVRHAPGFLSASLHRSLDGTKVTMYAQWRSNEDYQAMRKDPGPLPYLQQALAIAKFEPGMYEVVQTFSPAGCRLTPPSDMDPESVC
jgi:quinol monooxygenase YgiN